MTPQASISDLFTQHTHVNGDYILIEILKVLGVWPDDEDLSIPHSDTQIHFLDSSGRRLGRCKVSEKRFEIIANNEESKNECLDS